MLFVSRIPSRVSARCLAAAAICLLTASARAEEDAIPLAPDNPDVVAVIQVADIIECPAFQKIAKQFPDLIKLDQPLGDKTKLTARDIDSIVVTCDTTKQDFVVVFNLAREFSLDEVTEEEHRAKAEEIGDFTLYVLAEDNALCLIDESTVAVGPAKTMRAVLKRGDDAKISDELIAACKEAGDEEQIFVVATLDSLAQRGADAMQGIPVTPETIGKLKIATIAANASENAINISASLNCSDKETAEQLKVLFEAIVNATIQPGANTPAEVKETLGTVNASIEDEYLTITFDVGFDVILSQIKSQLAGANATAN